MPDSLPNGFLSKPEALAKYLKPERTFQRRLAKALRLKNESFLGHLYLVTSDNKIQIGTEVEHGDVERLKGKGLYPVWYLEESWLDSGYDKKPAVAKGSRRPVDATQPQPTPVDRSSFDREALVREIESLNRELESERNHNDLLTEQLDTKDGQIKTANTLAMTSIVREKEYTQLLKKLAERIPNPDSERDNQVANKSQAVSVQSEIAKTKTVEAEIVDSTRMGSRPDSSNKVEDGPTVKQPDAETDLADEQHTKASFVSAEKGANSNKKPLVKKKQAMPTSVGKKVPAKVANTRKKSAQSRSGKKATSSRKTGQPKTTQPRKEKTRKKTAQKKQGLFSRIFGS